MIPVVLLPGMMCDARMWGPVMGAFAGRDVIHCALTGADSMDGLAAQVLAVAPPRFALAGLSMGGIVAMNILAQAPERVERMALLDTNPRAEAPEVQDRRGPQIARAAGGGLAVVMRDEMKPNYLAPGPAQRGVLELCMAMALDLGPEVFARQSLALRARPDRQDALAAFRGPALVLMGEHDRLCPRDRHELMHALMPQSRLAVVAGAGHLPPLEQPVETMAHLRAWLEE
ncbi:MAG TPA: alpha/beta fold hydrolase [Paracoccaceae bacterium]|nr:alpha/beta fold hydrolase [Paracoccaceae bacterium]HMO71488.1 alpha/beta fold hydrolase [Paracoccaceae bacterium]